MKVCAEPRVTGLASSINRGSIFHRGWEATCGSQYGSRISRVHPERLSQSTLSKKLAFIHGIMTGRESKTSIRGRNYIQVQRDDYA